MPRVFVYGTLREGGSNAYLIRGARRVGRATTLRRFIMLDFGPYPGLLPHDEGTVILGEVVEVTDEQFAVLDELEEYPDYYTREIIETDVLEQAWIYILREPPENIAELRVVSSGDWFDVMSDERSNEPRGG